MTSSFDITAYRAMLRVREAYSFQVGGLLMRFYAFMRTIGTITMLTLSGHSFFVAGLVASVIAAALFIISPRVSKRIDEVGQRRVVPVATAVALVGCALMLLVVALDGPVVLCFVAAVLMGFLPTPQALTRARWVYLVKSGRLGARAPQIKTVFSYEGVIDDIAFMVSPALSIALASAVAPIAGMLVGLVSCVAGVVLLVGSKNTEPVPGWDAGAAGGEGGAAALDEPAGPAEPCEPAVPVDPATAALDGPAASAEPIAPAPAAPAVPERTRSLFVTNPTVRILFFLMLLLGCFYGLFDTACVSFAQIDLGEPTFASIALVLECAVSTVSGLLFGMIVITARQSKKTLVVAILLGVAYGFMALITSAAMLLAVAAVAAIFYAPFVITMNETCERAVPEARLTEALTWVTSGSICGLAIGPTLAGALIDAFGTHLCFVVGAGVALLIPVLAVMVRPLLKRTVD